MIGSWMFHAAVVGVLLAVAASTTERVLRLWRREARLVWGASMVLSIGVPLVALAQAAGWLPPFGELTSPIPRLVAAPISAVLPAVTIRGSVPRADVLLALSWLVVSLALTLRFVAAARTLARRRREWRAAVVDGDPLLVSPDAGPAVIGFRRPTIVVPEWVLDLDTSLRALVLRHEREHLERGDPRLLLGAVAVAVCAPWNPALWYQLHRLRSAMELDCDLRVLRAYPDARRYGSLLLAVAQRADRGGLLAAALTESNSLLARRIAAMRFAMPRHRVTRTLLLAAAAGVVTIVACEVQSPSEPAVAALKKAAPVVVAEPYFEFQVEQPVTPAPGSTQPRYPDMLRRAGVEGEVLAQFVVDTTGRAEVGSLKILKSSHDLFVQSVQNALPQMRFIPAEVGGRKVKQLVQQPFTYSISK